MISTILFLMNTIRMGREIIYSLIGFLGIGIMLIGCTTDAVSNKKAREHSQWVVDHIYHDTVFTYLHSTYLSDEIIRNIVQDFRERYKPEVLKGGFKGEGHRYNINSNNEIGFMYEYKSDSLAVKITLTYEIEKDTFELKALHFNHGFVIK